MGQRQRFARQPDPEQVRLHRLGGLLARWHCWRKVYRTERGYTSVQGLRTPADPEDALEDMLMRSIEDEIAGLPQVLQRVLGQLARAECLGVESDDTGSGLHAQALEVLKHRLIRVWIL